MVELLPACLILTLYVAALSLLLSVAQIGFRDIAIGLPLLLQVLMFTTPVLYPLNAVPARWRALCELNPLALLVEAFRGALLGTQSVNAEQARLRCRAGIASAQPRLFCVQDIGNRHRRRDLAMAPVDITVRKLSKSYRVRGGGGQGLFGFGTRKRFWALRKVSFDVRRGEALSVVGPNGSGKTTLIKVLSRITAPDDGSITIAGRLMSLVRQESASIPNSQAGTTSS